ncbi:hypothetical protein P3602_15075 [Vibrio parahaemolyticus]|uniref:hypothetical protein n=2 Tax=Vibrio parahaemolyticus TaxID=670 RepID=UPI000D728457|nr:hypothetical protein [Vibrio parahaemolyticus]MDF4284043.1 hypothetical protein [Vibrio parahaemolyticus]MDF4965478.1 hypothetical protein [Vibrio parahaemolyticus]MDF5028213.1 hypothetical protein [Vibrio parahaemolyticus]MDF5062455.1 hypothetical protein [Vibrio parahaemolyticus]MDF5087107.1 hypothetical protein [Vibrio parahaemolyticus]
MTTVFVSGSMRIKNLDENVRFRLKHIVESGFDVVVGDADGVDTSIQEFLFQSSYSNVTVYCTGDQARNNVGRWPIKSISSKAKKGSRAFFTAKDLAMTSDCDFGLMVWDTKSTGTLSNAIELLKLGKKSRIYVNKEKSFVKVTSVDDLKYLTTFMSEFSYKKANEKIKLEENIHYIANKKFELF